MKLTNTLNINERDKQFMRDLFEFYGTNKLTRKEIVSLNIALRGQSSNPDMISKNEACKSGTRGVFELPMNRNGIGKMTPSDRVMFLKETDPELTGTYEIVSTKKIKVVAATTDSGMMGAHDLVIMDNPELLEAELTPVEKVMKVTNRNNRKEAAKAKLEQVVANTTTNEDMLLDVAA